MRHEVNNPPLLCLPWGVRAVEPGEPCHCKQVGFGSSLARYAAAAWWRGRQRANANAANGVAGDGAPVAARRLPHLAATGMGVCCVRVVWRAWTHLRVVL
jgi:hypothetical protein